MVSNLLYFIDRKHFILNGINFEVQEGEALGIIGTSASGKTTLARLLVGVLEPSDGAVRLDSADIYKWSINGLGEWIGYVPQEQQLFEGSVADNIARMGDAYARAEDVISAAQLAGVHEMILKLPNGYDTDVGVNGKKLSGGQRQMICLARALFGSPKLIVMDEPNNSLDGQSEGLLLDLINRLKAKKITQIIVSHKPSILQDVDKMLVLGQSKQLMFGSRSEVLTWLKVGKKAKPSPAPRRIQQNIDQ
jgi:ABC-type protease/lipase transport system fused ATPase/permease subunit